LVELLGAAFHHPLLAPDDVIVSGFLFANFSILVFRRTYDLRRLATIQTTEEDEDQIVLLSRFRFLGYFTPPGDDQRPSFVSV